jgi:hypothetical protein
MRRYCGGHLRGPTRSSDEDQKSMRYQFVLCFVVNVAVPGTRVDVREDVHGPHRHSTSTPLLTPASSTFYTVSITNS